MRSKLGNSVKTWWKSRTFRKTRPLLCLCNSWRWNHIYSTLLPQAPSFYFSNDTNWHSFLHFDPKSDAFLQNLIIFLSYLPGVSVPGIPHAPTISGWPTTGSVNVSDSLTLTCTAAVTGGTPTSFEWYKGGVKVASAQKYIIASTSLTHKGEYKCKAINDDGGALSAAKTLDVKGRLWLKIRKPFHYVHYLSCKVSIFSGGLHRPWLLRYAPRPRSTVILASFFSNVGQRIRWSIKRPRVTDHEVWHTSANGQGQWFRPSFRKLWPAIRLPGHF